MLGQKFPLEVPALPLAELARLVCLVADILGLVLGAQEVDAAPAAGNA